MFLKTWRCITIVLAALALTMESAHMLELPQKMQYDAQMYAAVNTTLYRYFAIVGGVYQVGSIVMAAVLTFLVRKRWPSFGWTLTGACCLRNRSGCENRNHAAACDFWALLGSRDGAASPRKAASCAAVRYSKTLRCCCFNVVTTVIMFATKREPSSL